MFKFLKDISNGINYMGSLINNSKQTILVISTIIYSQVSVSIVNLMKGEEIEIFPYNSNIEDYFFYIGLFHLFQALLYKYLPCKKVKGNISLYGDIPTYNDNGFKSWVLTIGLEIFYLSGFSYYERRKFFENLGDFHQALNYYGIMISLYFYIIALLSDTKSLNEPYFSKNPILDFYKGVELHSQTKLGDCKMIINSRLGMMIWGMINVLAIMSSSESTIGVSSFIQIIYITKFFIWESGYAKTTDITVDRCGYYLFWGCICYVPCVYSSPTIYHYYYPKNYHPFFEIVAICTGSYLIYINWEIDWERSYLREKKENSDERDKPDSRYIRAVYKTSNGQENITFLVVTGWMSIASNINYLFEILATLWWTCAFSVPSNIYCYTYVIFLTTLLIHRTYRLEKKCSEKYRRSWKLYRNLVPYKIIPYVF